MKYLIITILSLFLYGCGQNSNGKKENNYIPLSKSKPDVTFIELGSVNCIPCRQMQPVMRAIESKYAPKVRVVFYDVWKPEQKHFAMDYKIKLIPTQVFLDKNGKEFFRHEGFFPEKDIDNILQNKGLKPQG